VSKILVVDDEPAVRDLTVEILRRSGYRPHGVASATHALEALEQQSFDLVVSDVVMPEMSGVELLFELRARRHELPVVLMTGGSPEPERTTNAVRIGASGLLHKPFSQDELRLAVATALERS
jgi:DNA-binding NtrC family response regulator